MKYAFINVDDLDHVNEARVEIERLRLQGYTSYGYYTSALQPSLAATLSIPCKRIEDEYVLHELSELRMSDSRKFFDAMGIEYQVGGTETRAASEDISGYIFHKISGFWSSSWHPIEILFQARVNKNDINTIDMGSVSAANQGLIRTGVLLSTEFSTSSSTVSFDGSSCSTQVVAGPWGFALSSYKAEKNAPSLDKVLKRAGIVVPDAEKEKPGAEEPSQKAKTVAGVDQANASFWQRNKHLIVGVVVGLIVAVIVTTLLNIFVLPILAALAVGLAAGVLSGGLTEYALKPSDTPLLKKAPDESKPPNNSNARMMQKGLQNNIPMQQPVVIKPSVSVQVSEVDATLNSLPAENFSAVPVFRA